MSWPAAAGEDGGVVTVAVGVALRCTLTLEVAFPFKSHGTLGYAGLMQELLRQWRTLLSGAVCAASERAERRRGSERERARASEQ